MNIVLTDGFDMYNGISTSLGLKNKWTLGAGTLSTDTGRFGGLCMKLTDDLGASGAVKRNLPANQASFCVGFAFKHDNVALLANSSVFDTYDSANVGQLSIYLSGTGALSVVRNPSTTLFTSSTGLIVSGAWNYIELFGTINSSTGTAELWLNGVFIGNFTGNTQNTANAYISGIQLVSPDVSGSTTAVYMDDLYLTDTAARLGERRIETLRPASDNTVAWTPNSGANNYSRVNESVADGDTSYVFTSAVGTRDLYNLGALSSTPTVIDCVSLVSFAEKTDATTRTLYNSCKSSGTDSDGSAIALNATYSRNDRYLQTDPNGGGAWTASRVNGLLIGPKLAS
jgi:hypothetical protein